MLDEIHRGLVSELRRADQASRVAIEGLVYLLAARTGRHWPPPKVATPEWLSNAVELVRSTYSRKISLSQIAAAIGVYPVTLADAFRRYFHKSVGGYITDLRIAQARQKLEDTQHTIAEIAQESGFYDESHMGWVFRHRFGVAPGALRRRAH